MPSGFLYRTELIYFVVFCCLLPLGVNRYIARHSQSKLCLCTHFLRLYSLRSWNNVVTQHNLSKLDFAFVYCCFLACKLLEGCCGYGWIEGCEMGQNERILLKSRILNFIYRGVNQFARSCRLGRIRGRGRYLISHHSPSYFFQFLRCMLF